MSGVDWYLSENLGTLDKLKPTPKSVVILGSPEYDYAITNLSDKKNPNVQKWSEIVSPEKIKPPKNDITIDKKI